MDGLKPYPAYKDSGLPWFGRVPAHWLGGPGFGAYREKQVKNIGLREKRVLSLSYGRIVVKPEEKLSGLVPDSFETYQIVDPGDIIIRSTDLQNDKTSLRVGYVRDRGIITSAYICLRPTTGVLPEFGYQLLNTYDLCKVFYGMGSGLRQNLEWADFKRMPVFLPPEEEQAAIVRYLDHATRKIDKAVRAKRKIIALLNEQKQAIIHRAVTRGLDPDAPLNDTGGKWVNKLPENWKAVSLRRVIHAAIDGPHFSPLYQDSGIPFLSARNVKTDRWSLEDAKYISRDDYREFCKRVRPEVGDVLYTKGGTTGVARAVDLDFPFQVWVHIAVLKLSRKRIDPEFLAHCLNSPKCYEQAQLFTRGATNQDLGLGRMKEIEIPLPPSLGMQRSIVEAIKANTATLDRSIANTEREIHLLREYRTRLIADVVTGKLDVREAAARLPEPEAEAAPDIAGAEEDEDALEEAA